MRVYLDFEFLTYGNTLEVISMGAVSDRRDAPEFYAESAAFSWEDDDHPFEAHGSLAWLRTNVRPMLGGIHFEGRPTRCEPEEMGERFARWVEEVCHGERPEFWCYYAPFDWFALCSLYGGMMGTPERWPIHVYDLKQLMDDRETGQPPPPSEHGFAEHHALHDARWNRATMHWVERVGDARWRGRQEAGSKLTT